jgi:2-iminobutanoate/2-iminopropanoate deaminase
MTTWRKEVIYADPSRVPPTRVGSSAHAVRYGPFIYVTGQSGRRPGTLEYPKDPVEQARQCLDNIGAILEAAGATYADVLRRTIIIRDRKEYDLIRPVMDEYFPSPVASSIVEARLLRDDEKCIEIEITAALPSWPPEGAA